MIRVKFNVEQIAEEKEEEVLVCCHDSDAIIYASFILLAKLLWQLIDYRITVRTAADINEKIRKRRREQLHKA